MIYLIDLIKWAWALNVLLLCYRIIILFYNTACDLGRPVLAGYDGKGWIKEREKETEKKRIIVVSIQNESISMAIIVHFYSCQTNFKSIARELFFLFLHHHHQKQQQQRYKQRSWLYNNIMMMYSYTFIQCIYTYSIEVMKRSASSNVCL